MRESVRALRWLTTCTVAVVLTGVGVRGQNTAQSPATGIPPLKAPPCGAAINYVGIEMGKPFTAEWRTESTMSSEDGSERVWEYYELVARDSAGRIRFEKRPSAVPGVDKTIKLHRSDGGTITTTRAELGIVVLIFDYAGGRTIQLQPAMQTARVSEVVKCGPPKAPGRLYSQMSRSPAYGNLPANVTFEELEAKEIDGIPVLGFRTTTREAKTEVDMKSTTGLYEVWVSDELGATVLETRSSLEGKIVGRRRLMNVKREEPDPGLFQIPDGYKVGPAASEMPYQP